MQSDIHVLVKDKERLSYEREELERRVRQLEPYVDECKKLQSER